MSYRTLDPATEELHASYPLATAGEIEDALARSARAFSDWSRLPVEQRASRLLALAAALESQRDELAALMALEMGKPLAEGRAEAEKCALGCRAAAEDGTRLLGFDPRPADAAESGVRYDPLGPLLAIMPWNFPFWQFFRFAAPALAAGNTVLLKHAPNTPGAALRIERSIEEAGFPAGAVQSLFLDNDQARAVIGDPRVRGITLTGSTGAGRQVAAAAGAALKPTVMELGGSDPFVVFDDADLDAAAHTGVQARCINSGQSCIAAKRFFVQRGAYDAFLERFVAGMRARVVGPPLERGVEVGPLAREDLRERLERQVAESIERGARVLCGGQRPERRGYFYPPTVLVDVRPGAPAAEEELFGPVATVAPFEDEAEAVALANGTRYGLGASVWTRDPARARRLCGEIVAGSVFVNAFVRSDPRLPFGGVKESGYGRELGREGLLQFVNVKTVWVA